MFEAKTRTKPSSSAQTEEEERKVYACRRCDTEITDSRALFCMRASSPEQVFPNPLGMMRVILTVRAARSLVLSGESTTDFTWFAGYGWRIAFCASCRSHLGWIYEGGDSEPHTFYG